MATPDPTNYSASHIESRPDRPLAIRFVFNNKGKKAQFKSARHCTYELLRERVQYGFSLSAQPFTIKWTDDDGEEAYISTEGELTEAILYHQSADDPPASSGSSILSYKSSSRNKIMLNVQIHVDYDGPSLSDASSLSSLEEYQERNRSDQSFSQSGPSPIQDDDAVTVTSTDTGSRNLRPAPLLRKGLDARSGTSSSQNRTQTQPRKSRSRIFNFSSSQSRTRSLDASTAERFHGNESRPGSHRTSPGLGGTESLLEGQEVQHAGKQSLEPWLRDQEDRFLHRRLPPPSDSDSFSLNTDTPFTDDLGISLEHNTRGQAYYEYRSGSSEASREDGVGFDSFDAQVQAFAHVRGPRPTSMGATSTESGENPSSGYPPSSMSQRISMIHSASDPGPGIYEHDQDTNGIPPELLVPDEVTDCSECGTVLDQMRYICTTCGEKTALSREELEVLKLTGKGKGRDDQLNSANSSYYMYPPHPHRSGPSSFSSSSTLQGLVTPGHKPLPALPGSSPTETAFTHKTSHPGSISSTSSSSTLRPGYELCAMCIQSKGVDHSLLGGLGDITSPGLSDGPSSPQDLSVARRAAPKRKGQLRHAFKEKLWGSDGWQDLEKDNENHRHCSGCEIQMHKDRYDCVVCENYALCRACFSDVHNIHPLHAFLVMPDQLARSKSVPELGMVSSSFDTAEESLKHPDVQCFHCGQDIVGARFHCVTCTKQQVDICSNCETAGLPGNLDTAEGEHNSSSHMLLKFPMPVKASEVQVVTDRVRMMASRDHANIHFHRSSPSSVSSSIARTVLKGRGSDNAPKSHLVLCNSCGESIVGSRFQCMSCPSKPTSYNLCSSCEVKSYRVHNPYHIFLVLDRPVDNPKALESETPLVRPLYKEPVGATNGPGDPEAYLKDLTFSFALCDRHLEPINGRWYRCAYCTKVLCADCQALDTHDDTHAFLVFKAPVDLQQFRHFAELDRADGKSPPVLSEAVYYS
ncbi:hypothetical protein OF83DRAFT_1107303 [Amylostereum chailletii]|nr:hypothetical protein OF83DRAFT_1107303 [Amylostereum chailletii]